MSRLDRRSSATPAAVERASVRPFARRPRAAYFAPMSHLLLVVTLALSSFGCAAVRSEGPTSPPPPGGILMIDVAKTVDATGGKLPTQPKGPSFEPGTVKEPTVTESLATQLRTELIEHGFEVVVRPTPGVPELRTEIRRWEPYQVDYSMVTVDVTATLVDGKTGATIWTDTRRDWNVATPGQPTPFDAALEATRKVAKDLVHGWKPDTGATPQDGSTFQGQ